MVEFYKIFLHESDTALDSLATARKVRTLYERGDLDKGDQDNTPSAFFGIWRGGTNIASYLTGGLKRHIKLDSFSAQGKSYSGIGEQTKHIVVYNMEELVRILRQHGYRHVFGVDDVFDTGRTWHAFDHIMGNGLERSAAVEQQQMNGYSMYSFEMATGKEVYILEVPLIGDIEPLDGSVSRRIITPYRKPHANRTALIPDFYLKDFHPDTEDRWPWIIFPWEAAEDLTEEELREHYPEYWQVLHG